MSAPLPEPWSEETDPKGRTYYSNHSTKETTWKRPVAAAAAATQDLPPPYVGGSSPPPAPQAYPISTGAGAAPTQPTQPKGPCCTPRLTFWIACGLGWIVWVFAVVAAADDDWIEDLDAAAGDEDILDACDDDISDSDFCDKYKAFTAMQFIAVLLVSFSMVSFVLTLFLPASGSCFTVKIMSMVGVILMAAFALFQMLAFVLVIVIEKDLDNDGIDRRLGGTFVMGVMACIFGVVHAAAVFVFARSSGDGLFYQCCHSCMANNQSNAPAGQQPALPTAGASAPPQPASGTV